MCVCSAPAFLEPRTYRGRLRAAVLEVAGLEVVRPKRGAELGEQTRFTLEVLGKDWKLVVRTTV